MPALFTNQFHAVQNKTCLAIYSKVLWNEYYFIGKTKKQYTRKTFTIKIQNLNIKSGVFFISEPVFLCQAEQVLIYLGIKMQNFSLQVLKSLGSYTRVFTVSEVVFLYNMLLLKQKMFLVLGGGGGGEVLGPGIFGGFVGSPKDLFEF